MFIDLKDAHLHTPIAKHHHLFFSYFFLLHFVWQNKLYQWKVLPFELASDPRVFTSPTKAILFLCHCKGFCIIIYLDDSLMLNHCKYVDKRRFSLSLVFISLSFVLCVSE